MKSSLVLSLFLFVGFILLTNHWGVAIRLTNWIFYLLILIALWKLIRNAKN